MGKGEYYSLMALGFYIAANVTPEDHKMFRLVMYVLCLMHIGFDIAFTYLLTQ
jgi:hypothetical protein